MKIRNINENYGDCVEFDSVEEMADAINETDCLENITADDLVEGVDYEIF